MMRYQVIRQDKSGEQWRFAAHGARFNSKASAQETADLIKRNGGRARLISCGREARQDRTADSTLWRLVARTQRAAYWYKSGNGYHTRPAASDEPPDKHAGGYARLDAAMRLKGEPESVIAAHCQAGGSHREESGNG